MMKDALKTPDGQPAEHRLEEQPRGCLLPLAQLRQELIRRIHDFVIGS
jgi:hypothetical protein